MRMLQKILSLSVALTTSYAFGQTTIDLNSNQEDAEFRGETASDFIGSDSAQDAYGVLVADINGDGYGDLIVGAPKYGTYGRVYVVFGSASTPTGNVDFSVSGDTDSQITGTSTSDNISGMLAAGDVNGDGIKDLVIGAYQGTPSGRSSAGVAYIFYGSTSFSAAPSLASADVIFYGASNGDNLGKRIAVSDLNSDGYDDVIIGAPGVDRGATANAGKVYVTYGSSSLSGTIDFSSATADIEILGTEENSTGTGIGNTVLAGDVNGDSRTDLFFGYYHAKESSWSNPGYSGVIWGIFGASTLNASYDLASSEYDFKTYGTTTSVYGVGYRGCIGDLNSDGYGDLVLYASDAPGSSVNVMFGGSTFASGSIEAIRDVSVSLPTNQGLGAVSSGDFNGDGIKDLFVGNPFASPTGGTWAGSAYLFYGNTSLPATLDISTDTDILITGDDANDYCGGQNTLGDVNGDGADDIFIASPNGDISGRSNCGKVYLIYGDAPTSAFSSPMFAGAGDIAPMFFSTARVSIDFNDPSGGAGTVTCEFNPTAPGGTGLPASVLPVYWSLTSTKTGTMNNTQVSFHYTDAQLGTMNENNLSVFTREGSGDDWTEVPGATVDANSNKITCETSHFSEWTVGENDEPLAIELSSFVAAQVNQKIVLAWTTESETDNKGFRLFRKENSDFVEIGNFYSHSELIGQGNKTSKTNYTFTDAFVTTGKTYSYKLVDVDFDGTETEHETVSITVSKESEQTSHKFSYSLEQNFPNPFNPNTTISYTLAKTNDVKLKVFNTKGELVRTLVSEKQNEGSHASNWNGTDERGNAVSSGVYYCKLTAGNFSQTQKMTLLK